ncbi:MAG TPA: hypothetical protein VFG79_22985 [Solirubrobacter sp.]|nr:hypothetical protein [Solirubrobacter sp.]
MSVAAGHDPDASSSYAVARQRKLRRTLESHGGVLTRERLYEDAHAECWHVPFDYALGRAIETGRVRRLSDDLFEAGAER